MTDLITAKEAREKSRLWKAELNKRAFIGEGEGAGAAYQKYQYFKKLADKLENESK